jgi:HEAT repeat protein
MFARTLIGDYDSGAPWEGVRALRMLGNRDGFDRAAAWCASQEPLRRARGADVLAQIGRTAEHHSNNFPDESFAVVSAMLTRETEALPLLAAIHALGHIGDPRAIRLVVQYRSHADADVRFAVACALGNFANDSLGAESLIQLTNDMDADVRDWATFGIGSLSKLDTPELREALVRNLDDPFKRRPSGGDCRSRNQEGFARAPCPYRCTRITRCPVHHHRSRLHNAGTPGKHDRLRVFGTRRSVTREIRIVSVESPANRH